MAKGKGAGKVIKTAVRPTGSKFGTDQTSRNGAKGSSKPKGKC